MANEQLILNVIAEIQRDLNGGDITAVVEMLEHCPTEVLKGYLPEDEATDPAMNRFFVINGYWLGEPNSSLDGYIVAQNEEALESEEIDSRVFFHGLSEDDLSEAVKTEEPVNGEFVVTAFVEISMCPKCGWSNYHPAQVECPCCGNNLKEKHDIPT